MSTLFGRRDEAAMKRDLLDLLRTSPSVSQACRLAGVTAYQFKKWKEEDEEFLEGFKIASAEFVDYLRYKAFERGVLGFEKEVIYRGEQMYQRHPRTRQLVLDDNFDPIPLKERIMSDRIFERVLEANVPEYARKGTTYNMNLHPGGGSGDSDAPTKIEVNFVQPPDWDKVTWDEKTGRPKLADDDKIIDVTPNDDDTA